MKWVLQAVIKLEYIKSRPIIWKTVWDAAHLQFVLSHFATLVSLLSSYKICYYFCLLSLTTASNSNDSYSCYSTLSNMTGKSDSGKSSKKQQCRGRRIKTVSKEELTNDVNNRVPIMKKEQ